MKKHLYLLWILLSCHALKAQPDTALRVHLNNTVSKADRARFTDHIYLLGKVWGFLKYYHPQVAAGRYNWDADLIRFLPGYCNVKTKQERSDSLEAWLNRFGEVPACTTCSDTLLAGAKLKPDFAWINTSNFSPSLADKLRYIITNRLTSGHYYINDRFVDRLHFVTPRNEQPVSTISLPSDTYGLLALFRFWNTIEYWYPYKYNELDGWDAVLKQFIPKMLQHHNSREYTLTIEELVTAIHDSHGFFSSARTDEVLGKNYLPFTVKFVDKKLFVTSILSDSLAALAGIQAGDLLESIDKVPVMQKAAELAKYCPASNEGSLYNKLTYWIIRSTAPQSAITWRRGNKKFTATVQRMTINAFTPPRLSPPYFTLEKDSAFCLLPGDIGYINVGNFNRKDSTELGALVASSQSLIIDLRQNQDETHGTGGGDIIGQFILPPGKKFVRFSYPQPSYPAVFSETENQDMGVTGNPDYFKGKIIILVNENTQSVGEFITMIYQQAPGAKVMGTTTAGADGNTSYTILPGGIRVDFTGLGVYYPDGRETQRVGIKPDIMVPQTIEGYKNKKDEQLEAAIVYLNKQH